MCRQRGTLLETSPALVAAHAEAGQEGESQQVEESGHHLVCLVRVGDQVSSHSVDCGLVLQKNPSEFHPKVRNHGEGPY